MDMITIRMIHFRIRNIELFSDEMIDFMNGEFYANTKFLLRKFNMIRLMEWGMWRKWRV